MRIAATLEAEEAALTALNAVMSNARDNGLSSAMIDRLRLTRSVLATWRADCGRSRLIGPIGGDAHVASANGLEIGMMRIPLGVIAFL
jgi:gamma-glutamyl phosphate reductase